MCSRPLGSRRTPTAKSGEAKRSNASAVEESGIGLTKFGVEPEMHARLVADLDHTPKRLIESRRHFADGHILGRISRRNKLDRNP
jgi:hypothetical protein